MAHFTLLPYYSQRAVFASLWALFSCLLVFCLLLTSLWCLCDILFRLLCTASTYPLDIVRHDSKHTYMFITLRAKLSGAVYCYRSCLWRAGGVCLWVCGSVTTIIRNCVHRSSPNWVLGKGSDPLQLIKFWPSRAPGKGSEAGRIFLAPPYYSHHAVFASLWALF